MNDWPLAASAGPAPPGGPCLPALGAMVEAIGLERFAGQTLDAINGAVPVGSWAVYRLRRQAPPRLHLSASCGVADSTRACFAAYEDGLWRRDRSFDAVRPGSGPRLLRMAADEAPSREHRERIYGRHRVLERLSVARIEADGSLLAVNLYRHEHQGRFGDGEVAALASAAPLLLAGVARHLAWMPAADLRGTLRERCPALTARELDVCERLLRGWSYDGIAADLGLSVPTVKTYRRRAFERLGLHFKSELFASFIAPPHRDEAAGRAIGARRCRPRG